MKMVLVVEDDGLIRKNLLEILEEEGFHAQGFANGQLAIDYLRVSPMPALILLDLMMPVMDGWQFRAEQMRDLRLSKIPVVVVTADGNAKLKAKQINAAGWVKKPIEITLLLEEVRRCSS